MTRRTDGRRPSAVASRCGHDAFIGETFPWSLLAIARCDSSVGVSHALRGKIAFVHPLGAVLAGCSAVLVHTLGLALATPNTGSSSAEGRGPHDRRHFLGWSDGAIRSKRGCLLGIGRMVGVAVITVMFGWWEIDLDHDAHNDDNNNCMLWC